MIAHTPSRNRRSSSSIICLPSLLGRGNSERPDARPRRQEESEKATDGGRETKNISLLSSLPSGIKRFILGWSTAYVEMASLRQMRDQEGVQEQWEKFRELLKSRWTNLNITCGLIMGAVSTIVFSDYPLSQVSFALGIASLLSSLIAIGFGVGLIYVLVDVPGKTLQSIDEKYPRLYLFALSIPELWALVSFGSFFTGVCVVIWEAGNKGWIAKGGVVLTIVALLLHLVAFGFLFHRRRTQGGDDKTSSGSDHERTENTRQSSTSSLQAVGKETHFRSSSGSTVGSSGSSSS